MTPDAVNRPLAYLASPYNHPSPAVRHRRFVDACVAAGRLLKVGINVYSPIAHTHPIAELVELGKGWKFYCEFDLAVLSRCNLMFILQIEGWIDSVGMNAEASYARDNGIKLISLPHWFVDNDEDQALEYAKIVKTSFELWTP